jgi:hypothetical protein
MKDHESFQTNPKISKAWKMSLLWNKETLKVQMQNTSTNGEDPKPKWTTLQPKQKIASQLYDV